MPDSVPRSIIDGIIPSSFQNGVSVRKNPVKPSSNFRTRWNAKKFFLTFPRCSVSPNLILNRILTTLPTVKVAVVAQETHEDGGLHVHIFLEFKKKHDVRNPLHFDHLCQTHGNISVVRSATSTLRYITKEHNYVLFGITEKALATILNATSYALGEVAAFIEENPDINEVAIKFPTHFIHYHSGLTHLCTIHRHRKSTQTKPFDWNQCHLSVAGWQALPNWAIYAWFDKNFSTLIEKPLRSKQLWLHGCTQLGKSRFLAFLCKHWRGFKLAACESFYGGYNDYDIDFLYLDEFHGNKKLFFLNSLLGGEPMNMPFKGGQYCKRVNKPVVICSNLSPSQCYATLSVQRPLVFEAFLSRLLVLDITDFNLHALLDDLDQDHITTSCHSTHVSPQDDADLNLPTFESLTPNGEILLSKSPSLEPLFDLDL